MSKDHPIRWDGTGILQRASWVIMKEATRGLSPIDIPDRIVKDSQCPCSTAIVNAGKPSTNWSRSPHATTKFHLPWGGLEHPVEKWTSIASQIVSSLHDKIHQASRFFSSALKNMDTSLHRPPHVFFYAREKSGRPDRFCWRNGYGCGLWWSAMEWIILV